MSKFIALCTAFLLIGAIISVSYFIAPETAQKSVSARALQVLGATVTFVLGDTFVSAEEGLWTCLEDVSGRACQEYPAESCQEMCNGICFPGKREDFASCALGTCIDPSEGTCSPQTPQQTCTESGGLWDVAEVSEIPACRRGCCLMGGQAQYVTEQTCTALGSKLGLGGEFRPVANELACIALSNSDAEGACVVETASERQCKFTTKMACSSGGGSFHEGYLCSHPDLETECESQTRIGCVEGKDGVYWFDSCGNRENIYDANRIKSWNNGLSLPLSESCELGTAANLFARQSSCGNCNYLLGSVCGAPGLLDSRISEGNAVCRNLNCVDENGDERKHGESWCAFESQIGSQGSGNGQRSIDVPGSSHYRQVCFEGEIKTEPCQGFRNEVCVETRDERVDFSQAACRVNQWQNCIAANTDSAALAECEQTTDCRIHTVNLGKSFTFDRCVPNYPPGFDLRANQGGEVGETICSLGSQKCTVLYEKTLTGRWKCVANCDCTKAKFTETMNNLCMSLGDCGASVNVAGEYSDAGYTIRKAPKLGKGYADSLKMLATPVEGQKAETLSEAEFNALLNLDPSKSSTERQKSIADFLGYVGLGGTGVALAYYAYQTGFSGLTGLVSGNAAFNFPVGTTAGSTAAGTATTTLGAFANGFAGAAVGASVGFLLGKVLGVEGDLLIAVTLLGALGGGLAAAGILPAFGSYITIIGVALWGAILAGVAVLVIKLLGLGDTKKVTVNFECKPWQPPKGGNSCELCGKDGLPCNLYQCQSLGQLCAFVNEGTNEEACINIAPNDVSAPILSPLQSALLPGYSYTDVGQHGYGLRGPAEDGCIPAYTRTQFGISINERAACRIESVRTTSFDDMTIDFGGSNLYRLNHTQAFAVPTLDALAQAVSEEAGELEEGEVSDIPIAFDERSEFTFYVRCEDPAGNSNIQEYAINFCISPAPDITPPAITQFIPASPGYASIQSSTQNISFFVNEPSECRWSTIDQDYSFMSQQAQCDVDIQDMSIFGWECSATLPASVDATYYFRCKDQPWLIEPNPDNKTRNSNSQSVSYELKKTTIPLVIERVAPQNEDVRGGGLPVIVDLEVETSGGAPGVRRWCEFNVGTGFIQFFSSNGDTHTQPGLTFIDERAYSIPLRCRDEAGNEAVGNSAFTIEVDQEGPFITRAYSQDGLTVITNEPALCAYSFQSCIFSFDQGTLLEGMNLIHTTSINQTATYYVKCRDEFDNPGACLALRKGTL